MTNRKGMDEEKERGRGGLKVGTVFIQQSILVE